MAQAVPARRRIVVDGSNIATEGRTLPSLAQLDEAIRAFLEEYPGFGAADVTVVVDASFGHRIDPSEVAAFEQAVEHGEMVTPPAGAEGRGDGFILRIAEKSGALVLSNDSFQEFHAERPWLFESGRLIGGKPVPGVGWVFTPRTPVRGPRSRSVTSKSKRDARLPDGIDGGEVIADGTDESPAPRRRRSSKLAAVGTARTPDASAKATKVPKAAEAAKPAKAAKATKATKAPKAAEATKPAKATGATAASKATKATKKATKATVVTKAAKATKATKASTVTKATKAAKAAKPAKGARATKATAVTKASKATNARGEPGRAGSTRGTPAAAVQPGEALNDPLTFLNFVAENPVGSTLDGVVTAFTSHGAHIDVGGMICHVPLRGLGDPPPQKARQVLSKGESRTFSLVSLEPARRRAELALAGGRE